MVPTPLGLSMLAAFEELDPQHFGEWIVRVLKKPKLFTFFVE